MLHGKKPTREQKNMLTKAGLDWKDWLVVKNLPYTLIVAHRTTEERKVIEKR